MNTMPISEGFDSPTIHPRLKWFCPPAHWSIRASHLVFETDTPTDFWQRTHYGFSADNGHLLFAEMTGNFAFTTKVRFSPVHQYDQAGLLLRHSSDCWIKASVEFEPAGPSRLGTVITRDGYSDWSMQDFPAHRNMIELRVELRGQDALVEYRLPDNSEVADGRPPWTQIRLGHLPVPEGATVQAGVYACSPKGAGFIAEFDHLSIDRL